MVTRWVFVSSILSRHKKRGIDIAHGIAESGRGYILTEDTPELTSLITDGAKWNARNFIDEALEHRAEMINFAEVEKVIIENKTATGVEYKHNKETHYAYAPRIIVAAGGIGSPLILRKSGMQSTGYDFFFDPLVFVYGKIKGLGSGKSIPMSTGVHFDEDGIVMTDINATPC